MAWSRNSHLVFVTTVIAAIFPITSLAAQYIVGDGAGWTVGFDYQAWADGQEFRVGDMLVFQYPAGAHNVFKVNATGFQNCIIPPKNQALTSGNDTVTLASTGPKWYLCGVGSHCSLGQKLSITVQPPSEAAPAPRSRAFPPRMAPAPRSHAFPPRHST